MSVIQIENLVVTRGNTIICSVPELTVKSREHLGVGGDNGSGKTTLLRVIAGLERHHHGSCRVNLPWRHRVFVGQNPILFRGTVLANAMYGLRAHGRPHATARREALRWLDAFGISKLASAESTRLSGGERRRTALARAMAFHPDLLLLDEPLADLDEDGRQRLDNILGDLNDTTVLMSSPSPLPDGLASRYIQLSRMNTANMPANVAPNQADHFEQH